MIRKHRYSRGRSVVKEKEKAGSESPNHGHTLLWGNRFLPARAATQHFLAAGTTGSGKSLVQRRLLARPLAEITVGKDSRALIFDAKGDTTAYLNKIGVTCPVFTLNPFDSRTQFPAAVAWDIARDITSPARAQNLTASLLPIEKSGANQYFTDAARQVVTAVVESFIRHSGHCWTFSDLVFASLCKDRLKEILLRDPLGGETFHGFFGDERSGYAVFTTIVSRMSYFRPVAGLWQRNTQRLSARDWLKSDSILILGSNATAKTSLDAINEQVFRVITEEIDVQANSATRRTWIWIDEARLSGPLLRSELLPFLAVKGRSKGVAIVLAFQDMEGLREAAGARVANELVAQCSNKALLRMESKESSSWASKVLGQYETIETFRNESISGLTANLSEQRVQRDAVLASEFYNIPVTTPENGLTGYFLSPETGATRSTIRGTELSKVAISESAERQHAQELRSESDQWIKEWSGEDRLRLGLTQVEPTPEETKKRKLVLNKHRTQEKKIPVVTNASRNSNDLRDVFFHQNTTD
jgi:hypothetical protein